MEPRYRNRQMAKPIRPGIARRNAPADDPARIPPQSPYREQEQPHSTQVAGPLLARFIEEDKTGYFVGEIWGDRTAHVQKRRAEADPSSPEERRRRASERLLRWSSYALVGVLLGGVVGILLGGIVVLAALIRMTRLSSRIHRWKRHQRTVRESDLIPAQASRERMQSLAALGQGLLAIALGSAVLVFLILLR